MAVYLKKRVNSYSYKLESILNPFFARTALRPHLQEREPGQLSTVSTAAIESLRPTTDLHGDVGIVSHSRDEAVS